MLNFLKRTLTNLQFIDEEGDEYLITSVERNKYSEIIITTKNLKSNLSWSVEVSMFPYEIKEIIK